MSFAFRAVDVGQCAGLFFQQSVFDGLFADALEHLIGTFLCVGLILERIAIIPTFHCVLSDVADAPVGERHF